SQLGETDRAVTDDFSQAFDIKGADGLASLTYELHLDDAIATGLIDTETGEDIVLRQQSDGTIEGVVDDGSEELAFTISIDPDSGEVTFQQERPLQHSSEDTEDYDSDVLRLPKGAISIEAIAEDNDGDTASATVEVGDKIAFQDDGPSIEVDTDKTAELIVSEEEMYTASSQESSITVNLADVFGVDYGGDGAADTDALVYQLTTNGNDSGLADTETDQAIKLSINANGDIEGRTENSDDLAFTVSVNNDGDVTLTLNRALKHSEADSSNYDEDILDLAGKINLEATATDKDGDTATESIDLGALLQFKDHGPTITTTEDQAAPELTVFDEDTISGTSVAAGNVENVFTVDNHDYGADGEGSIAWAYQLGIKQAASGLTSGGEAIELTIDGNTITAKAGGDTVFTIEL